MGPPTARAKCKTPTSKTPCLSGLCFSRDYFDSKGDLLFLNEVFRNFRDDVLVFQRQHSMDFNQ